MRTDFRVGEEKGVNIMLPFPCRFFIREPSFPENVTVLAKALARRLKKLEKEGGRR